MPRPSRLQYGLSRALISSSQPLHDPASTWRIVSARPRMASTSRWICSASTFSESSQSGGASLRAPLRAICLMIFHIASRSCSPTRNSQVVPRIAEVEGVVDQRKVGNDVADHRILEHRPVLPRGIMAVAAPDAVPVGIAVELESDEDLAAPTLDPTGADRGAGPEIGRAHV